jgi:hypothetical protein
MSHVKERNEIQAYRIRPGPNFKPICEQNELAEKQSQNAITDLLQQAELSATNVKASEQEAAALEEAARENPGAGDDSEDDELNERKRRHKEAGLCVVMASRAK